LNQLKSLKKVDEKEDICCGKLIKKHRFISIQIYFFFLYRSLEVDESKTEWKIERVKERQVEFDEYNHGEVDGEKEIN
jgi:hypothetical protein